MGWIRKQTNILEFTLSSLLRRKGRNASLMLVYTVVVAVLASAMFFTGSIKEEASMLLDGAPGLVVQRMAAGRHDLIPLEYLEAVKGIRGVRAASGRLWGYYYDPVLGANYTVVAPEDFPHAPGSVAIGSGISRGRQAFEGDTISLRTYEGGELRVRVGEVIAPGSGLVSADLVLMSQRDFRALFGIPEGLATDLALEVTNPRETVTVAEKVARMLPDTRPIVREEILRTYDAVFNWRGGIMVALLSTSVLAFVIFAWDRASGLSAEEKREIGILKAIGWETAEVLQMKFWEGAVVSLASFFMGVGLAYAHVYLASPVLFGPVLKGWSTLYPEFKLMPAVDFYQIATLFFLTVVPYTAVTVVPSWRAATMDPDTVMRT